ncbi:hypothetical protein [Aureliella helgolandensis]|uniref:Uncharacterized protein n=1 Tax=Aureliella helgolandensis TaxID=2527968 RepID=A0A518GHU0_9BACT|nr:hypothetical protein [Aureliella helgolandensis]QDV28138.1 hypothetical protein Q31a_65330 [Aureliella helgolandensis]
MNSPVSATSANSQVTGKNRAVRSGLKYALIPFVLISLSFLSLLGLFYFNSTLVSGTELNCLSWETRRFSFRREPFTNIQISGIRYTESRLGYVWSSAPSGESSLLDTAIKRHLKNPQSYESRWDLVDYSTPYPSKGPADILVTLLCMQNSDYDQFWSKWTANEPAKAKILWPAALDLVQFQIYAALPELLELATFELPLHEFQSSVNHTVQNALVEYCRSPPEPSFGSSGPPTNATGSDARVQLAAQTGLSYGDHPDLQLWAEP